jgi:hypothetical protein
LTDEVWWRRRSVESRVLYQEREIWMENWDGRGELDWSFTGTGREGWVRVRVSA